MVALGPNYRKLFVASTISNLGDGISLIAYPWLASAITRNPLLIATVGVVQRLPWLLFTLPAGVTDCRPGGGGVDGERDFLGDGGHVDRLRPPVAGGSRGSDRVR